MAQIRLADGATLQVLRESVDAPTVARMTRLLNAPPSFDRQERVGAVYEVALKAGQPRNPVVISLPFDASRIPAGRGPDSLALAHWDGSQWRPIASWISAELGFVTAHAPHLSLFSVVSTTKFIKQIATTVLNPTASSRDKHPLLPRDSTQDCIVLMVPPHEPNRYTRVEVFGDPLTEVQDEAMAFVAGPGAVFDAASEACSVLRFTIRIPKEARLGLRNLVFSGKGPKCTVPNAFSIGQPLVVIVDIDGLRQDVFYDELQDSYSTCKHIRGLAGKPKAAGKSGGLSFIEFENGIALKEATTVFPTVTFAGHAGIFSGCDPRDLNMAGNEWFDRSLRDPYKFAFTGDNLRITGEGDSRASYIGGRANDRLLASGRTTVYQDAWREMQVAGVVHHNMYFGEGRTAAAWKPYTWVVDELLYLGPLHTHWLLTSYADRHMIAKAIETVRDHDTQSLEDQANAGIGENLGIVTLYYAGLDHLGHEMSWPQEVRSRQQKYLQEVVEPSLGRLIEAMSEATYKSATFLFVSDHGQTDMAYPRGHADARVHSFSSPRSNADLHKLQDLLFEWGYNPSGVYRVPNQKPAELYASLSSAVVGLNAGMAHVYLRRSKEGRLLRLRTTPEIHNLAVTVGEFEPWDRPPSFNQVIQTAENFRRWNEEGLAPVYRAGEESPLYRSSLDLILVRNVERSGPGAPYQVYLGPGRIIPFREFLAKGGNHPFTEDRYGWTGSARDADFLADRVSRLQSGVSGDLILIPKYPLFYFEYSPLYGDHGGLGRSDFEVPLVVVRPSPAKDTARRIQALLAKTIDLRTKNRPAVTDVKETVLEIFRGRETVPLRQVEPDPVRAPARITLDPPEVARVNKGQVQCRKDHPLLSKGVPAYAREELKFTVRYALSDPVSGLRPAAFVDGHEVGMADRSHAFGLVGSSPLDLGTAGRHELTYRFPAPEPDTLGTYEFALLQGGSSLAKSQPIVVSAFPRGWSLSDVLWEPKSEEDRQFFNSDKSNAADWKSITVQFQKGVLQVARNENLSGSNFEKRIGETVTLTGIPGFVEDNRQCALQLVRGLSLEMNPRPRIVGDPAAPFLAISGIVIDHPGASSLKLGDAGRIQDEGKSIPFKIDPRDASVRRLDLSLVFQEQGARVRISPALRRTVILRYVRIDEK